MMFWVRKYKRQGEVVIAFCDEELLGKEFKEGERVLEVSDFYKGELVEKEKVKKILKQSTIINSVGEKSIALLLELEMITSTSVKRVEGVPHVQIANLSM